MRRCDGGRGDVGQSAAAYGKRFPVLVAYCRLGSVEVCGMILRCLGGAPAGYRATPHFRPAILRAPTSSSPPVAQSRTNSDMSVRCSGSFTPLSTSRRLAAVPSPNLRAASRDNVVRCCSRHVQGPAHGPVHDPVQGPAHDPSRGHVARPRPPPDPISSASSQCLPFPQVPATSPPGRAAVPPSDLAPPSDGRSP